METIWKTVKESLKGQVPAHSFRMWIEPLEFSRQENNHVVLSCSNQFLKRRIQEHYSSIIESELQKVSGKPCLLSIEVAEKHAVSMNKPEDEFKHIDVAQQPLPNMSLQPSCGRLLRKNFTFERFIVSANNKFAYSAAMSFASHKKNSGQNAMFLLSNTGMGKSHLSQAISHYIISKNPRESVYYITAEDFTNEMVYALKTDSIDLFKEKYRNRCDVLILEDIHFLTGKERTQIELVLALDYLMDSEKKIIFTSCYRPSEIPKMSDQLRSRLTCGLIPQIEPPDFQTRLRILREKAKENRYEIPDTVMEYIAAHLSDNVRQLESGLIGVATKSSLMATPITITLAESVIKNMILRSKSLTVDTIKDIVCQHYRVSLEDLVSKSRKHSIALARHVAIWLSKRFTKLSIQEIGKNFNRYHATAIRSIGAIERGIKEDAALKKQIEFFCEKIEHQDF